MSDADADRARLSSSRLLARNVGFSFAGQALAMVVAIVAVPVLVNALGTARFGVLTIALAAIAYASVFDLGLGRALTKMTAEAIGRGRQAELPELFWTTVVITTVVGLAVMVVLAAMGPWLAGIVLNVPDRLETDATISFVLLAVSVPVTLTSSALRGYLEAHQRFDLLMVVTFVMSLVSYGGPAVLVQAVPSLPAVVALLLLSRCMASAVLLVLCVRVTPALRQIAFRRRLVRPLMSFGGWVTLTALGSSTIGSLDRFVIGGVVSASAVAYYATPVDAVTRMLIVSGALVGVLFPAFALNFRTDPERTARLFSRGTGYAFAIIFPGALAIVTLAPEILEVWLGGDFARRSAFVMQWAAAGVLLIGMAQVVYGFVQSDRPDLIAKLMAIELPLYVVGFLLAVHGWGIQGAAVAFTARLAFDAAALSWFARSIQRAVRPVVRRQALLASGGLGVLVVAGQLDHLAVKLTFLAVGLCVHLYVTWRFVLEPSDRERLLFKLQALQRRMQPDAK